MSSRGDSLTAKTASTQDVEGGAAPTSPLQFTIQEVHTGTIYKACGWTALKPNKPLSWTTTTRKRNREQTLAPKIRWEKELN